MSHLGDEQLRLAGTPEALSAEARLHLDDCPVCELRAAGLGGLVTAAVAAADRQLGDLAVPDFGQLLGTRLTEPVRAARRATLADSFSLAGQLLNSQFRMLPRLLTPVTALAFAAAAVFLVALPAQQTGAGLGALVSLLVLLGTVWGGEPERGRRAELALTLPVSPIAVFLTRLLLVLTLDLALALLCSVVVSAAGAPVALPELVLGWLGPSLLASAVASAVTAWRTPWLGLSSGVLVWALGWLVARGGALYPESGLASVLRHVWPTTPVTLVLAAALFAVAARLVAAPRRALRVEDAT
ncbi:hypothetical protein JOF53_002868 [Crossiella equi]|uniref:Zinc-finger domain-containing protein n=1 Tax=Crossiella equi TaxID=130796 RepID=A0ABS5ABP8_9PSEU|nr:hypothetical protein [Crossiella equi]MBP2473996.1 hypothetical protein [Crossiella equi]